MPARNPAVTLMKKYRKARAITLSGLAYKVFGSRFGAARLRAFECGATPKLDEDVWKKICIALEIPESEMQGIPATWEPVDDSRERRDRPDYRTWSINKERALHLPPEDETTQTLRPVDEILIRDDMHLTDIVTLLLAGVETDGSLASKLGLTERSFNRRYQEARRVLLTAGRFHALRAAGYHEERIAHAHGYNRKTLWLKKREWGIETAPGIVQPSNTSHSRKGLPKIETKWGLAFEYRKGYYMVGIRRDSPYWNHPIAPHNQVLLHRITMLEHLLAQQKRSEFLTKVDGKWTFHKNCQIHHLNGDTSDNRIENLEVTWRAAHIAKHWHGANRLRQAIEELIEGRDHVSSEELRELLEGHFDE